MCFNSILSLIRFLGVLGNIGYLVPFYDFSSEFKKRGFDKHIHCYTATIELDDDKNITLTFHDREKEFSIFLQKGLV